MLQLCVFLACFVAFSAAEEICYEPCGCFNDDYPFDLRPLPEHYEDQDLDYRLFTPESPSISVSIRWNNIPSTYNPSRKTVFLIHGWNGGPSWMDGIRSAFFETNHDVNVIVVNWSLGASRLDYTQAASNIQVIAGCTAHLATVLRDSGASLSNMHCVGHSLGGHTCGGVGHNLNGELGRITGMDPAGPWFWIEDDRVRLDASDAVFVDNIHTNAGTLGIGWEIGHIDFYPNNARVQPSCDTEICDHNVSINYMRQSIRAAVECQFTSRPCSSEAEADEGRCETCGVTGCNRMGYHVDPNGSLGRHYLRTVADPPYCEA